MTNSIAMPIDADRILEMTRVFRAPRELVIRMFSRPELLTNWWGPVGFSVTTERLDFRPGGDWKFTMHGPDGKDWANYNRYVETGPDRLVFDHSSDGGQSFDFRFEIELDEFEPGRTKMTFRQVHASAEALRQKLEFGVKQGLADTLTRLETLVLLSSDEPRFTISRHFRAPQELVWKAWTEADRLQKWWGPKGCTIQVSHLDVRPGGMFHFAMESERGKMWGRFVYRDVRPTSSLTFVNSFSDERGGLTRAPFSETWPLEVLNLLTLTAEDGGTRLRLEGTPLSTEPAELKQFVEWFDSLTQGFGGTFDQLEEYLLKA